MLPELADQKKLEERFHMAATYMRVLQSSNRVAEQQDAAARYATLNTAFNMRDSIMARAGGVSNPQVVADGADKHIVDAILSGQIETLNAESQVAAAQSTSANQSLERHYEMHA